MKSNHPAIAPSMLYAWASVTSGVPSGAALCDGGHRLHLHLKTILCSVAGIYVRSQEEGRRADQPNTLGSKVVRRWRVTTRWIGGNLSALREGSDYFNNNSQRLL